MDSEREEAGATRDSDGDGRRAAAAEGGATAGQRGLFGEPWLLAACLCVVAAVVCLVLGFYDAAFVTAALGAVAWFLNLRTKLPRPPDDEDTDDGDDDESPPSAAE